MSSLTPFSPPLVSKRRTKSAKDYVLEVLNSAEKNRVWAPVEVYDALQSAYPDAGVTDVRVRQVMRELARDGVLSERGHGEYSLAPLADTAADTVEKSSSTQVAQEQAQHLSHIEEAPTWAIEKRTSAPDTRVPAPRHPLSPARSGVLGKRLREVVTLTLYPGVSAGNGSLIFDEDTRVSITVPRLFIRQILGIDPPPVMGVSDVEGDSMEPLYYDGDLVLYQLTPEATGGIYVVNYDGRLMCKRVQRVGQMYRLIPENRTAGYVVEEVRRTDDGYATRPMGSDQPEQLVEFGIVGRVLWPQPTAGRIHIQQVGDLLRKMLKEAAEVE